MPGGPTPIHLQYQLPMGLPELRETVAEYLRTSRAVRCDAEQILIVSGSTQALDLAARVLLDEGSPVWIEEPGYFGTHQAMRLGGARLVPVPVDDEGLDVEAGIARCPRPRAVFVTPSHQLPLGMTMSASRRIRLLEWAHHCGAWIIEDDYDGEYRYGNLPIASLQGLDRDRPRDLPGHLHEESLSLPAARLRRPPPRPGGAVRGHPPGHGHVLSPLLPGGGGRFHPRGPLRTPSAADASHMPRAAGGSRRPRSTGTSARGFRWSATRRECSSPRCFRRVSATGTSLCGRRNAAFAPSRSPRAISAGRGAKASSSGTAGSRRSGSRRPCSVCATFSILRLRRTDRRRGSSPRGRSPRPENGLPEGPRPRAFRVAPLRSLRTFRPMIRTSGGDGMRRIRARWQSMAVLVVTGLAAVGAAPTDDDPFAWLEDVQGEKGLAWAKEQNAKTTPGAPGAAGVQAAIYKRTLEILDSKEKIPTPELLGETVYNFWKDDAHERGIWRRTTLASYRTAAPAVGDGARRGRARQGGGQGLGLPRRDLPPAGLRAVHGQPLARRLRRRPCGASSTRRRRRSSPAASRCRRPSRASPGATRTRSGSGRTSGRAR